MAQLDAQLESMIHELHRGGLSSRQIAAKLTASGRKVSKSSVAECLRRAPRQPLAVGSPSTDGAATDEAEAASDAEPLPDDPDALATLSKQTHALWAEATKRGDLGAALRAMRLLIDLEVRRRRIAEHDDNLIVMRRDDLESAAARCRAKLHELLDKV